MKSGFVAIVGKPNVGKSSLINKLVGQKVAIVSPKPETTRVKTLGVLNEEGLQIAFVDTPGFVRPTSKFNEFMAKSIESAQNGVDCVILVLDGGKPITLREIEKIKSYRAPVIIAFNKMDILTYEKVFKELAKLNEIPNITIVPVSAKTGKNLSELKKEIIKHIPEGPELFDKDFYTDKSIRYLCSEIIREKIFWLLNDEVPHGINVDIIKFEEKPKQTVISADIICDKESHKPIIIGKGGAMLKDIGTKARIAISKLLNKNVFLELFVKVRENWRDDESLLRSFGFDKKNI